MESLFLPATHVSPEVSLQADTHTLSIRGESYPENAAAFYNPVIESVRAWLAGCGSHTIVVNISLAYFNSSSTKMLFTLFEALHGAAVAGSHVRLNWYRDEEDETILEFGQELRDDFPALDFVDLPLSARQA